MVVSNESYAKSKSQFISVTAYTIPVSLSECTASVLMFHENRS